MASRELAGLQWAEASLGLPSPAVAVTFLTGMASRHPDFSQVTPGTPPEVSPPL